MYFLLAIALLTTFIYINLCVSDAINARLNPYSADKKADMAELESKIKYGLLLAMAFLWSGVIRYW